MLANGLRGAATLMEGEAEGQIVTNTKGGGGVALGWGQSLHRFRPQIRRARVVLRAGENWTKKLLFFN